MPRQTGESGGLASSATGGDGLATDRGIVTVNSTVSYATPDRTTEDPRGNDPGALRFGMEVEMTMVPFTTDEGNEAVTFGLQSREESLT